MARSVGTRRVGIRMSVAAGGTARVFWGPFRVGERVSALRWFVDTNAAAVAGDLATVEIKVFNRRPADTVAAFAANGRSLTGDGTAATQPQLPLLALRGDFPVDHSVREGEVIVGVEVTGIAAKALEGSWWIVVVKEKEMPVPEDRSLGFEDR